MDLAFYYDHPAFFGTFKMSKVFDETYYEGGEALEPVVPGAPRGFVVSVSKNFGR